MIVNKVNLKVQEQKILEKCYEVEAGFWHILLREIAKTTKISQEESLTTDLFKDMFCWEVANIIAKNSNSGLAEELYKQFMLESSKAIG